MITGGIAVGLHLNDEPIVGPFQVSQRTFARQDTRLQCAIGFGREWLLQRGL